MLTGCSTDSDSEDANGFTGGSGTKNSPWRIETAEQLGEIRNNLDGHYILNKDIDLSAVVNFASIGRFEPVVEGLEDPKLPLAFTGVFDGNGHKISNVSISAASQAGVGLFGCVAGDNGVVKNLVVENVTVSGAMLVGGVIGYGATANPTEHITLQGKNTITGNSMVGGIVGGGFSDIKNCTATANVFMTGSPAQRIGILAGGMETCSIISCTATITVTGADCSMIGGLIGHAGIHDDSNPTVINGCIANAVITAPTSAERIGGIVGSGFYVNAYKDYFPTPGIFEIKNSSSSGSITSTGALIGTIAGYIYDNSTVENTCSSTMTINGRTAGTPLVGGNKTNIDLPGLK
jgi:hypothetical protein